MSEQFFAIVRAIFASPQMGLIVGLIVVDLGLGVALALRTGVFAWRKLADFYRTSVVPYILGYVTLSVVLRYLIPAGFEMLSDGAVLLAWGTLVASLAGNVGQKLV